MIKQTKPILFAIFPLLIEAPVFAQKANSFDCSVIYDEYDSLMYNQYLKNIGDYVSYIEDSFTIEQFENEQKTKLKLHPDHQDYAIAVFKTNQDMYGKMLFRFSEYNIPNQGAISYSSNLVNNENNENIENIENDGNADTYSDVINQVFYESTLTIDDLIIYQRVDDGYAPVHYGPIIVKANHTFDIDGFGYFDIVDKGKEGEEYKRSSEQEKRLLRGDFELSLNDQNSIQINAINDAKLYFPTQSLCQQ